MTPDNAGHVSVKLNGEDYLKGKAVSDFIEFKRDSFFVTLLETDYFAIVVRPSGSGLFSGGGTTKKIPSLNAPYLSMGLELVPGPRLDESFILVRDRRGIQIVNLALGTSH